MVEQSKMQNNNNTSENVGHAVEDSGCHKTFIRWICCKNQEGAEIEVPPKDAIGTIGGDGNELPGYLNRFGYKDGKTGGSFSDGTSSDSGCSLNRKSGSIGGKSITSDALNSECDSGLGSASDSGRRSKDQSDASEKSDGEKSEKSHETREQPSVTLEQIKANFGRKPKRTESTLSRFSSIFSNDGRKLTDVLVEEFRLNDRFSGLSMDRIWGGFMDGIKEEDETGNGTGSGKGKDVLETIDEHMTPDTRAKRAINEKKNQRRRRRRPRNGQRTSSTGQNKMGINQASNNQMNWQKDLPADWQDVINI